MVEKIKNIIKNYRSGLTLLAMTLVISVVTACVCYAFGGDRTTAVVSSAIGGTLSVLTIHVLFVVEMMPQPMSSDWGVLGTIIGTIITMIAI